MGEFHQPANYYSVRPLGEAGGMQGAAPRAVEWTRRFEPTLECTADAWQRQSTVTRAGDETGCRTAKGLSVSSRSSNTVAVPRARSNARNP